MNIYPDQDFFFIKMQLFYFEGQHLDFRFQINNIFFLFFGIDLSG